VIPVRLAVVIPVFNEKATLPELVRRLDATLPPLAGEGGARCERRLILVDDASTDGTAEIVGGLGARPDVTVVRHPANRGKGAALRSGFAAALKDGADLVLVQDGDLEYDPADHETVLRPIISGRADAVIGSRFLGQTHRVLYYRHSVANRAITMLSNMLTNLNLTDIECCFKAFSRPVVQRLAIEEERFGVEPEIVARLAKMRLTEDAAPGGAAPRALRVFEVPVAYAGRTYAEGKKITWRDGFSALRAIVKYNLMR
jgi:glycosyltransferase involved in cell wall biosynthesis